MQVPLIEFVFGELKLLAILELLQKRSLLLQNDAFCETFSKIRDTFSHLDEQLDNDTRYALAMLLDIANEGEHYSEELISNRIGKAAATLKIPVKFLY